MSTNIAHLLNATASWTRPTRTGSHGRFTETPVVMDAALPVRQPAAASGRDLEVAQQLGAAATHTTYADASWAPAPNDYIDVDGRSYRVIVRLPPSKADYHVKVLLEERQYGSTADA